MNSGCGDDGGDPTPADARVSPLCREANDHSDIEWLQQRVFIPSCSLGQSCHSFNVPALDLDLETDAASAMIGQPSARLPDEILIIPGDPQNSYLMVVLGSYEGENPSGLMPPEEPLCIEIRQAIERWISALPAN